MKRYVQITDVTGVEGQKRLDHYNQWLMDPARPFTSTYPGYPGDEVADEEVPDQDDTVTEKTVAVSEETVIMSVLTKEKHMSKLDAAVEIVKANPEKQAALAAIVETLGVTRANAFVYWSKAQKALGAPAVAKVAKTKAVAKAVQKVKETRKTNPVTGTTPAKAKAKIAEIDAVIANLKASGAQVASPFPAAA